MSIAEGDCMPDDENAPTEPKRLEKLADVTLDPRNANAHTQRGSSLMETSIREVGFGDSIVVDRDGVVISGGQRTETSFEIGMTDPIVVQSDGTRPIIHQRIDLHSDDPRAKRLALLSNRVGELNLSWDAGVIQSLIDDGVVVDDLWSADELATILASAATEDAAGTSQAEARATLAERFGVPPFSVLDARQGYWQTRKQAWITLGIQSELGRGIENLNGAHPETTGTIDFYKQKRDLEAKVGRELTKDEAAEMMRANGTLSDPRAVNADRQHTAAPGGSPMATVGEGGLADGLVAKRNASKARRANAAPGGSRRPAMKLNKEGKTDRGDGKGRAVQLAPGGRGKNSAWK
jgi:hypothetical protein